MQYYVYSNLDHDKKSYSRGDTVELTEQQAAPLLEIGVIGTDKPIEDLTPKVSEDEAAPSNEVTVGGEESKSGEPSVDGNPDTGVSKEAEDLTPKVQTSSETQATQRDPNASTITTDEPAGNKPDTSLEDMSRNDLRDLAIKEGIAAELVSGTFTAKATIIELIQKGRADKAATQQTDPSANL